MNKYLDYTGLITLVNNIKGLIPPVFGSSGSNHSSGLVPDPGAAQGTTKYLREDGTWAVPEGNTDLTDYVQKSEIYEQSGGYVDLGLPSGLLWAQGNIVKNGSKYEIGAETDYGAYVSWGNIVPHFSANGSTFDDGYNWGSSNSGPYASTPGASIAFTAQGQGFAEDSGYDAARELLGGKWKMPTTADFKELNDNCTSAWVANYNNSGVAGRLFTSKINGATLFFPAAGYGNNSSVNSRGSNGIYWSRSLCNADGGYGLLFGSSLVYHQNNNPRYYGFPVRAVTNTPPSAPKYAQKSELADVATSGSYNDLEDKPAIPDAQIQSDWNQTNSSAKDFIKNKPTIPVVPINVSDFNNDAGYLTQHQDISGKADKSEMSVTDGTGADSDKATIQLKSGTSATVLKSHQSLSGKEDVTIIVAPVNATDATLPITTLTCEVGKYYRVDVAVDTLAVTLPAITDSTTVRTVVIYLTGGTTPAVTIASADNKSVYYQDGFEIETGSTYEINALFNGAAWIVAAVKINIV